MKICVIGKRFRAALSLLTITLALLPALPAAAASVSYTLDQSNDLPDGIDYLRVTIADSQTVAGDIDLTVEVIAGSLPAPGGNFGIQSFFFNADDELEIGSNNILTGDSGWTVRENRNAGGSFGKFDFGLHGSGRTRTETLNVTITGVEGDTIESYALGYGDDPDLGAFFAAHTAGFDDYPYGVSSAKFGGSFAPVPVPPAGVLLGSAILLLARRRRSI